MLDADERGQLAFKRLDLRPQDETLPVADARDRPEQCLPQRSVLSVQIEKGDPRQHGHSIVRLQASGTAFRPNGASGYRLRAAGFGLRAIGVGVQTAAQVSAR